MSRQGTLPVDGRDVQWWERARCRAKKGVEAHDAVHENADGVEASAFARNWCGPCPVREACLKHALATRQRYGVWGGLTPSARERLASEGWRKCRVCGVDFAAVKSSQRCCSLRCRRALARLRAASRAEMAGV